MTIEQVARVAHEANRAYCLTIGDSSQVEWVRAPTWQRDSAIDGVRTVFDEPTSTPKEMHAAWWDRKRRDGWVYGPTKDEEQKIHPCCQPYDDLPTEQRVKDVLFGGIVRLLLGEITG